MSGASGFRRPGGGRFARRVLWLGVALAVSGVPVSVQGDDTVPMDPWAGLPAELRDPERLTLRALLAFEIIPRSSVAALGVLREGGVDLLGLTLVELREIRQGSARDLEPAVRVALDELLFEMRGLLEEDAVDVADAILPPAFRPLPPMPMPPEFPVEQMSEAQYTGMITTAMEATRVLMGPLSPEEEERFAAYWGPYFDFPDGSIIEHFRQMTPLLSEFINVREALDKAAEAFDEAWEEAVFAAEYDSESHTRAALNRALMQQDYMAALQQRADELAGAIQALGDAPDPVQAKEAAAQRHQAAIDAMLDAVAPPAPYEGVWVGYAGVEGNSILDALPGMPLVFLVYAVGPAEAPEYRAFFLQEGDDDEGPPVLVDVFPMQQGEHDYLPGLGHGFREDRFRIRTELMDEDDEEPAILVMQASRASRLDTPLDYPSVVSPAAFETAFNDRMAKLQERKDEVQAAAPQRSGDAAEDAADLVSRSGVIQRILMRITESTYNDARMIFQHTPAFQRAAREWLETRPWDEHGHVRQDLARFQTLFASALGDVPPPLDPPQEDPVDVLLADLAKAREALREARAAAEAQAEVEAEAALEAVRQRARIETHETNIAFIEGTLERDQEALAVEEDPDRRAELEFRIITAMADLQSEQDRIASIQTGQPVHTRSVFDDYAHQGMIANIRKTQRRLEDFDRAVDSVYQLATMLPETEHERALSFIENQLTPEVRRELDHDTLQRMASALGNQVQGYREAELAAAEESQAWAELAHDAVDNIRKGANHSMMVASLFGGRPVNLAYQSVTGYIAGGPMEAVLQTATYMGPKVTAAAEAMRGYREEGIKGALWRGSVSFATSKAMEYGFSQVLRSRATPTQRAQPVRTGSQAPGARVTAAESRALAEFRRGRQQGEKLVRDFQNTQQQLQAAGRAGRSAEEILLLQSRVRHHATAINGNPHAKNFLKFRGAYGTQSAYNAHLRSVHAEVEANFHAGMQSRGWNQQPLREFRNAASAGSVGMDFDIGLDERMARTLRKGGQRANLNQWQTDAQRSWDQAYRKVTGRPAAQAWENVTTSVHAESYRDVAWLSSNRSNISRGWGQQASDVTRYKAFHTLNDPRLDRFTKLQEVSRTAAKDFHKLPPVTASSAASEAALRKSRQHWGQVHEVLERFGENGMDPISATREIERLTGGRSIPEVVDDMATLMEAITKFGPR
ncbi:hypothetical protein [Ectothiorhodospira sp. BSL-9]|uniref:hypothetical protein n=1 Tax=Ectothiorhodospira sp. BSL-9 TaxID=1442136 RepID=UPI0007B4435E|nr:hypothetical protein [Ectothiorhodospira sp. BSL-9]ANB03298.1 hypothetical protein ECTOBSL9_2918 [Ectothiorhodospira sp. BSL-9]